MEMRDQGCGTFHRPNAGGRFMSSTTLIPTSRQSDSPYKGGTFHFNLSLPENFPFKAPSVCPAS